MGQFITLTEFILIITITLPVYALIKAIIEEYEEKINH